MLTEAERKIIQDLANGRTYKETANELGTSEQRIKNLALGLFRQFGVQNKFALIAIAFRQGLVR